MANFDTAPQTREIVPDWMEEQLPGYIADDGTYDHESFIQFLQRKGYPYATADSERIRQWGVQLGQMLKFEESLEQEGEK